MANAPKQTSAPPFWRITDPGAAVGYGINCGIGDRWELDATTARKAKSEGWATYVPKPSRPLQRARQAKKKTT